MMLTQQSQVRKYLLKSKTEVYIQRRIGWSDQRSRSRIWKGQSIGLKKRIKNIEGRSTSSEEGREYFGAKGTLSFKIENIMCDMWNIYIIYNVV